MTRHRRLARSRRRILVGLTAPALAALMLVLSFAVSSPAPGLAQLGTMPPRPDGWPSVLHLGMSSGAGGAASMQATAPFGFRYQYLAGGVNTGDGWSTWNSDGAFVTNYIRESTDHGMLPVFTYYMIRQSAPGGDQEVAAIKTNLATPGTMKAYYEDLHLFFVRAGAFPDTKVVLHVEPDLWGFLHQQAQDDDAATISIPVGSTGIDALADLPDDASGFARAIVRLRDQEAPNVLLGYHLSFWGAGTDIFLSKSPDPTVDLLATRSASFYRSLRADFDLAFAEFSDRDAGFKQANYHDNGRSWWNASDFARQVRFLATFVDLTGERIVLWQIPYGNTRMRAMNNTWNHYQDNRVEWLLDDPSRQHLQQYVDVGTIAFLFGRGADGATNASDAAKDGVTNPAPINGNTRTSLSADDDGGFFRERAAAYYADGALALP
ncbi:MAG: hypothetical protein IT305_01610 [Chloroflexi bacterium]|nr:hypothetical protein [Chloroflexota bacterium]